MPFCSQEFCGRCRFIDLVLSILVLIIRSSGSNTESQTIDVPDCMPFSVKARCLGLGEVEYKSVLNNASDVRSDEQLQETKNCTRMKTVLK